MKWSLAGCALFRRAWAIVLVSLATVLVTAGVVVAQTPPVTTSLSVVLPEQVYAPGLYDTGAIAIPPGAAAREQLVCVLSTGAPVEVSGEMMYSVDGGQSWQEWAPFGMSLGGPTWDSKRNQWLQTPDSCSGSGAADTTTWTHLRLFVNVANEPALLSATIADANPEVSNPAETAGPEGDGPQSPVDVPDGTQPPNDTHPD